MSKAFGKILFERLCDEKKNSLVEWAFHCCCLVKYEKSNECYVFNVPMYDYLVEADICDSLVFRKIKVSSSCLEFMCGFKGFKEYFDKETGEVYKYPLPEKDIVENEFACLGELHGMCLDEWYDLCIVQHLFCVNKKSLREVRRNAHRRELNRVKTSWCGLPHVVLEPKRGRPIGTGGIKQADWETKMFNVANYKVLVEKFVRKDFYQEFMWLEKDRCDVYHEDYVAGKSKVVWKVLRYKHKVACDFCEKNVELEKDLKEKCNKYKLDYESIGN